jgi:hypothetical protein
MIKNSVLGVACALALFACASPNPTGDSSQTPAQTPAQAAAPAALASAVASIKIQDVTINFDHFGVVDSAILPLTAPKGVVAEISSQSVASDGSSDSGGLTFFFSGDPSCHYADGAVFQLTDPCIFIGDFAVNAPLVIFNTCQFKNRGVAYVQGACPLEVKSVVTTGTLTLRRWSPSGPIEFSFSPGAQLTAIVMRSVVASDTLAVPVSGTVSAK